MAIGEPFVTIDKLAEEVGVTWSGYQVAVEATASAEKSLRDALQTVPGGHRLLPADTSLVLFGSFARHEMLDGSDYDWSLLIDGVVDNDHAELARTIGNAFRSNELKSPGTSGTFGNIVFSHDLVHRVGGGADSNANLTRRMLMLLESRSVALSDADSSDPVWDNVLGNILERYFEEDVHFVPAGTHRVPRFLLNDLTRYWRTICVDYAAKYREQDGKKWAIRNAKLRFSRKLIYASGLAFCLSCELDPPTAVHTNLFGAMTDTSAGPFMERAKEFARTPALEYLAAFMDAFVENTPRRKSITERVFGTYDWWLRTMADPDSRSELERLDHSSANAHELFQELRQKAAEFAKGLESLFFGRDRDQESDKIANLVLQYIGF